MTQEEKLQKEIARIVSCEEELNYFENKGDLIDFVARHFYEIGKNADETIRKELIFFLKEEIPQCSIKEHADKLKEFVYYLEKQKDTSQELEQEDENMKDCTTCKYGYEDERLGIPLCHHPSEDCVNFNMHEEKEIKESENPVPNDLEEAAEKYEKKHTYQRYDGGGLTPEYDATLAEAFIAGAKWQKEQMMSEAVEGEIKYCYACGMHDRGRELQSLYEQLKKLM